MKRILSAMIVLLCMQARAQNVGIGTASPDASAKLDISSTNSGILIPRLSTTARNSISNPARGLMVYDSTIKDFYYYNGAVWKALSVPGELVKLTESGKTGYRLRGRDSAYYGAIGNEAIDFSVSTDSTIAYGATGDYSAAFGLGTMATGEGAFAMGYYTHAYSFNSLAAGSFTFATGANSLSTGLGTNAGGDNSLAAGLFITAPSMGETAVGTYNTPYTPVAGGELTVKKADRAFVVGIGTSDTARKDGLIVYKDGTLALQRLATAPDSVNGRLYTVNNKLFYNGAVLFDSSQLQRITERGKRGYRMLGRDSVFYGSIGEQAIDLSYSNSLSDTFGATGNYAAAIGTRVTASGENAVAIGFESRSDGSGTIALGTRDTASGINALAMGFSTKASGVIATSLGDHTIASGSISLASGLVSTAAGDISTTMGDHTTAKSYAEVAIGSYNTDYIISPGGVSGFFPQDRALVIGTGTHDTARNDALIVYKDGTVELDVRNTQPAVTAKRLYVVNDKLFYNGGFLGDSSQLQKITENGKTGYRLLGRDSSNYGNIGANAIDLSLSTTPSAVNGATGDRSVAMGTGVIASGIQSVAIGFNALASGIDAIALGNTDSATGNYAVALGLNSNASGFGAVSTGFNTQAIGANSFTAGANVQALGNFSVAAGSFTRARSMGEAVFGTFNTNYQVSPTGAFNINGIDRALVIGIGTHDTARKDGLVVYKDGTLSFYKQNVMPVGSQDKLFAFGNDLYYGNKLLSGYLRQVTRNGKTGFRIVTYDDLSQDSMGQHAVDLAASNYNLFRSKRIGDYSFAAGFFGTPSGMYSCTIGQSAIASGSASISLGNATQAKGNNSAAMGIKTIAPSFGEMAVGSYNTDYTPADSINFNSADRAFVVGIGPDDSHRKNGLILFKDGSLELSVLSSAPGVTTNRIYNIGNTLYINGAVVGTQTSDARYKERIENIPSVLTGIRQLRPVTFHWKNNKWGTQKEIGFLAQELKDQFPEVVSTDADGYYKVNYGLMTAVLTKGMQEQQTLIERQQKEIESLLKRIEKLESK